MSARRSITALLLGALFVAACSAAATPTPSQAPASQAPASQAPASQAPASQGAASPSAGPVTIGMATVGSFGSVLTGPNGMTLYTHAGDTATTSTCTGGCATAWPPLTVAAGAQAMAGTGVTGTIATLTRADGTTQVSYNGLPLYYWQSDAKPGDVTGDGVDGFAVAKASGGGSAPAPSTTQKPGY